MAWGRARGATEASWGWADGECDEGCGAEQNVASSSLSRWRLGEGLRLGMGMRRCIRVSECGLCAAMATQKGLFAAPGSRVISEFYVSLYSFILKTYMPKSEDVFLCDITVQSSNHVRFYRHNIEDSLSCLLDLTVWFHSGFYVSQLWETWSRPIFVNFAEKL